MEREDNTYVIEWQQEVRNAQSISRLFVLLEILDLCIDWDKSVANTVSGLHYTQSSSR